LGAGHTVTALYEIAPADDGRVASGSDLRYVDVGITPDAFQREEILTVRLRYKEPDGDESKLVERTALDRGTSFANASIDFRFATAVAELGMILRDSEFKGSAGFDSVIETAKSAKGKDDGGYRAEFVELAEACKSIKPEIAREE
jgi:Ca-activated chloride channel family protein